MIGWIFFAALWLTVGIWMVRSSESRGLVGDLLFGLLGPVYIVADLLGLDP